MCTMCEHVKKYDTQARTGTHYNSTLSRYRQNVLYMDKTSLCSMNTTKMQNPLSENFKARNRFRSMENGNGFFAQHEIQKIVGKKIKSNKNRFDSIKCKN